MKKIETIWHYLLFEALEHKKYRHTQAGLAAHFHYSTSTINLSLVKPEAVGAVRKSGKFFVLTDPIKLLYIWATLRNLSRDIIYSTRSDLAIGELEGLAPPNAHYGLYSATAKIFSEPPADYSTLYLYLDPSELALAKTRYPVSQSGNHQIVILKNPPYLPLPNLTSLPHTYVDIWNVNDWYAVEFLHSLEDKIHGLLS